MADVARFVFPEPPRDDARHIKGLFVNRERELEQALEHIAAVCTAHFGRPMAIVGQARVGKSHLMQLIADKVGKKFDVSIRAHLSEGFTDGRDILRSILHQVYAGLSEATLRKGVGPSEGPGVLAPLDILLSDYSEAVAGTATEIEVSRVEGATRTLKKALGLSLKAPGIVSLLSGAEVGARIGSERTQSENESEGRKVRISRFEERHLSELLAMAHSLVREHTSEWRTLLVIDDFDLLKRDEKGNLDPDTLLRELFFLAAIPGFYVLTTVRQDTYSQNLKSFHTIADVLPFADEPSLVEIYRRHVKFYNDGVEPFFGNFVEEVARLSNGRSGVFLQHLREAWETRRHDLSTLELRPWIRERWAELSRLEPALADVFKQAVLENNGFIDFEDIGRIRGSILHQWILEDYTSEEAVRVDSLLAAILREAES